MTTKDARDWPDSAVAIVVRHFPEMTPPGVRAHLHDMVPALEYALDFYDAGHRDGRAEAHADAVAMRAEWEAFLASRDGFPHAEFWNALDVLLVANGCSPLPAEVDGG